MDKQTMSLRSWRKGRLLLPTAAIVGLFLLGSSQPTDTPALAARQEPATLWIQKCIQGGSPTDFQFNIYDQALNLVASVLLQASDFSTPKAAGCAWASKSVLLTPGQYYLQEILPDGWQLLSGPECRDASGEVRTICQRVGHQSSCGPQLQPGQIVWCTFTNAPAGSGGGGGGGGGGGPALTIVKRAIGGDGTFLIPMITIERRTDKLEITTSNGVGQITGSSREYCLAREDQVLKGDCRFVRSRCRARWACDVMAAEVEIPPELCDKGFIGYIVTPERLLPPYKGCVLQEVRCEYENECKGGGKGGALSITKTCEPRTVTVGLPVTCTITVTNGGNKPEIFQITEQLPSGMEFISATPTEWVSPENGQLIIRGSVGANSSVQITIVAIVTGHGPLMNAVQLGGGSGSPPCDPKDKTCPPGGGGGQQASATVVSRGRPSTVGTAFLAVGGFRTATASAALPKVPKGVLLVDSETNRLLVYLSKGDGTFRRFKTYATAESPMDVKAGDFDGDGKTDAVVVNSLSDSITVFLGNGDGTFRKGRELQLPGTKPVAVTLADFDRDGVLDLAIAEQGSADVAILLGRGDGTFRPLATIPLFEGKPSSVAVADWDEDGVADLIVTAIETNEVVFFRGDGRGRFSEVGRREVGEYPISSTTGDFDRDGQMDIAIANLFSNSVTLLLSRGKSRSLDFTRVDVDSVERPTSIISGEFFGGTAGVVVPNLTASMVTFIGFDQGRPRIVRRLRAIAEPVSLGLGDFNDDGLLDVVVAGLPTGSLATLLGRENGTFALKR